MKPVSLAVVVSHPIQHYVPVYRELAKNSNIQLKVFFVAENGAFEYFDSQFDQVIKWDVPLTQGYDFKFLTPGKILTSFDFFSVDCSSIVNELKQFRPDYIWVNGYAQRANWRAIFPGRGSAEIIYTADSNIDDSRGFIRRSLKSLIVRLFLMRCDHYISYGPRNRRYLEHYGVKSESLIDTRFPVDIERLERQRTKVSATQIKKLRLALGIPEDHMVLLFAGKLVAHKRPEDVVHLVDKLRERKVSAMFVGSGTEESQLKLLAKELKLETRLSFVGFVNQAQIAPYFVLADIFIFPSKKEPYGAIASEVLPFGLPIVAADNIGCVGASIIDGTNGLLYSCGDIGQLTVQVERLLDDPVLCDAFSDASLKLAGEHDKSTMASCISKICES